MKEEKEKKSYEEIKKILLELLKEDEMVKNIILNLVNKFLNKKTHDRPENGKKLKEQISNLENNLKEKEENIKSLKRENEILDRKTENLENQINKLKMELKQKDSILQNKELELKKLKQILEPFEKAVKLFENYKKLSSSIHSSLENVFVKRDFNSFFYCGVQYGNLKSLWDFIKSEINRKGEYKELEVLKEIFYYFFDEYNKIYDEPRYELLKEETGLGETYDYEFHVLTSDSEPSGAIKKILLYGFKLKEDNKIIKKSLVRI